MFSTIENELLHKTNYLHILCFCIVLCEDDTTMGPMFIKEPENRVDFSNTTGAIVECTARGSPRPEIIWIRADGTAVGDVPGLRQVRILIL